MSSLVGLGLSLQFVPLLEDSTHHNLRPAGVAAVEAESHHVGLAVYVTCAVPVLEV